VRGYLAHIAAKVTGTRPAVRPRVPSLFEPVKGAQLLNVPNIVNPRAEATAQESGSLEQDRFVDAALPVTARPSQEPVRRLQSSRIESTSQNEQRSQADSPRRAAVRGEERPKPVAARVISVPVERAIEAPSLEAQPTQQVRPQPIAISQERERDKPGPAGAEAGSAPRRDERTTGMQVERVEREAMRIVNGRDERKPAHEGIRPIVAREEARRESTPTAVSSIAHVTQPVAGERMASARESISEGPPPVQVTIGRLIVEAVTPPSAPAPAPIRQAVGPRLSLDDYLRQRGGRA